MHIFHLLFLLWLNVKNKNIKTISLCGAIEIISSIHVLSSTNDEI